MVPRCSLYAIKLLSSIVVIVVIAIYGFFEINYYRPDRVATRVGLRNSLLTAFRWPVVVSLPVQIRLLLRLSNLVQIRTRFS